MGEDRDWPIEFRFLEKLEYLSENTVHRVQILQVRYRDDNTGVYYAAKYDRYTEWQDVPVVREP